MARKRKELSDVKDYRYDEKRKNKPPAGMVSYEKKVREPVRYFRNTFPTRRRTNTR